jgi:hypothetical protein
MSDSEETLKREDSTVLRAIAELSKKFDGLKREMDEKFDGLKREMDEKFQAMDAQLEIVNNQLEVVRRGIVENSARFDQLEAIALEAKSIALITRSQVTILTEEIRNERKSLV